MSVNPKEGENRRLFEVYKKSEQNVGLSASDDELICPLCWKPTPFTELSIEHVLPGSVGGRKVVLTCTTCNNTHGTAYDSQLANFQRTADAFKGHGTIPTKLTILGKSVVANTEWLDGAKNLHIVGEASNPSAVEAIQEDFTNGKVSEMNLTLDYGYYKNRLHVGLLRCAYLAIFKRFGYQYASTGVVQTLRRRISDSTVDYPNLKPLIGQLKIESFPYDEPYVIVPGDVNGTCFYMVIIRLRMKTESFHFVFMPVPVDGADKFFETLELHAPNIDTMSLKIPPGIVFT